jgi:hypothetical protein
MDSITAETSNPSLASRKRPALAIIRSDENERNLKKRGHGRKIDEV